MGRTEFSFHDSLVPTFRGWEASALQLIPTGLIREATYADTIALIAIQKSEMRWTDGTRDDTFGRTDGYLRWLCMGWSISLLSAVYGAEVHGAEKNHFSEGSASFVETANKTARLLPKMRGKRRQKAALTSLSGAFMVRYGTVHTQYIRCGKPSCRCAKANGGAQHGPYYYHFERINGKQYKRYIPAADVAEVVTANRKRVDEQQFWTERRRADIALMRRIRTSLRGR